MTIGTRIKELRIRRGLTQDQIADKLDMNRANFSHYERDTAVPPSETLSKIADILDTTTDYLLGRREVDSIEDEFTRMIMRNLQHLPHEKLKLFAAMLKAMLETDQD